jgi:hypothetical protein
MFVGSKTFLNRVAIIAGSFLYLNRILFFPQVYHKTRIHYPHLWSQSDFVQHYHTNFKAQAGDSGKNAGS